MAIMETPFAAGIVADTPSGETAVSAVSWAAVWAGAFVIVATSLILLALGSAGGLAIISPWPAHGASLPALTAATLAWLVIVQWLASALGGYVAGRLRIKWARLHTDEVFFRDTAHGLLTWAVSAVLGTLLLAVIAAGMVAKTTASTPDAPSITVRAVADSYPMDVLLRPAAPGTAAPVAGVREEVARVLLNDLPQGGLTTADRTYLTELVAARTGVSTAEARARLDAITGNEQGELHKARQLADQARKTLSGLSLGTALSMLVGAFIAAVAATLGGRARDLHA